MDVNSNIVKFVRSGRSQVARIQRKKFIPKRKPKTRWQIQAKTGKIPDLPSNNHAHWNVKSHNHLLPRYSWRKNLSAFCSKPSRHTIMETTDRRRSECWRITKNQNNVSLQQKFPTLDVNVIKKIRNKLQHRKLLSNMISPDVKAIYKATTSGAEIDLEKLTNVFPILDQTWQRKSSLHPNPSMNSYELCHSHNVFLPVQSNS